MASSNSLTKLWSVCYLRVFPSTGTPDSLTFRLQGNGTGFNAGEPFPSHLWQRSKAANRNCIITQPTTPYRVDINDYRTVLVSHLSDAWELAHENIRVAQERQKTQYNRVGSRLMVHMPGELKGRAWKFARPFHGPYRVVAVTLTNPEVQLF